MINNVNVSINFKEPHTDTCWTLNREVFSSTPSLVVYSQLLLIVYGDNNLKHTLIEIVLYTHYNNLLNPFIMIIQRLKANRKCCQMLSYVFIL